MKKAAVLDCLRMQVPTYFYEKASIFNTLGATPAGADTPGPTFYGRILMPFQVSAGDAFEFNGKMFLAETVYTRFGQSNDPRLIVILVPATLPQI